MSLFYRFSLGRFSCTTLLDMTGEWDLATLFADVDSDQLDAALAAVNETKTWPRVGALLFIETEKQKILVDSGLPPTQNGVLAESMAAAGISPTEIDTLLITHGDGDHIGGIDQFPNAEIVLPREAYRLWTEDEDGMVAEFIQLFADKRNAAELAQLDTARRIYPAKLPALKSRLRLVEPEVEILPGLRFVAAPGHRRDHFAVEIRSGAETLLHIVDGFRHPLQAIRPEIFCIYDSYPDQLAKTTEMLMGRAADADGLVFGAHLPWPGLIRIAREGDHFIWKREI